MRVRRASLLAPILAALASGCHDGMVAPPDVAEGTDAVLGALPAARATWEQQGPDRYTMVFHWNCFCPTELVTPARISVENGTIVSAVYATTGAPVSDQVRDEYRTVDGLFDLIQEELDDGADWVRVEFDPDRGYPRSAFIDYERGAADEELGFELSSVTELR